MLTVALYIALSRPVTIQEPAWCAVVLDARTRRVETVCWSRRRVVGWRWESRADSSMD